MAHPFDQCCGLADDNLKAVFDLLTLGPEEIQRQRRDLNSELRNPVGLIIRPSYSKSISEKLKN